MSGRHARILTAFLIIFAASFSAIGMDFEDFPIHGDVPLPDLMVDDHPISFRLMLDNPGFVTLAVEDSEGRRVANIISAQWLEAGDHTISWNGLVEDSTRGLAHGINDYHGRLAEPGVYTIRGLVRDDIKLRYEMSAYTEGVPPWTTADRTGRWLADHSAPADVQYLPEKEQVLIISMVAEAGDGVAWVDLTGRKVTGRRSIGGGGGWWGGYVSARDAGEDAVAVDAYKAAAWRGYLQLWSLNPNRRLLTYDFEEPANAVIEGLAAHNKLIVISLIRENKLLFVDAESGAVLGKADLQEPRGLTFDSQGRLLAISEGRVLRFQLPEITEETVLPRPEVLVAATLEAPQRLAIDDAGNIYVSDQGNSHQVKVFNQRGSLLRTIGTPGGAVVGAYYETRMQRPLGITITGDNRLWVAENSESPKRVSVWTLDGEFVQAMYGPPQYGGGGSLDTIDKTRLYYATSGKRSGLQFSLDWETGDWKLVNIYFLPNGPGDIGIRTAPQAVINYNDRRYMTNAFNSSPTGGTFVTGLWEMRDDIAIAVAAVGVANDFEPLKDETFQSRLPEGADLSQPRHRNPVMFAWSDLNGDGKMQPEEVTFKAGLGSGYVYFASDLTAVLSDSTMLKPQGFTQAGAPIYDARIAELSIPNLQRGGFTSGGNEMIYATDGWTILTGGPMRGYRDGQLVWTYPSHWPSLHASHGGRPRSPIQQHRGQMIGTTRILGMPVEPKNSDAGKIWAVNGNMGNIFLVTTDGLFVDTLFKDFRSIGYHQSWIFPEAKRGMLFNETSARCEHFWPTINQTADGNVYLIAGFTDISVVHVDGLESVRRLPSRKLTVAATQLAAAHAALLETEAQRLENEGRLLAQVSVLDNAPTVDGDLVEWEDMQWLPIGQHAMHAKFHAIEASVAVSGDRIFAAYKTGAPVTLQSDDSFESLLLGGSALELLIGADSQADAARRGAVRGDTRIMVTRVNNRPRAYLYRQVDPASNNPTIIRSAWRAATLDRVIDVTEHLQYAQSSADYEFSLPLSVIGLNVREDAVFRADIGVALRTVSFYDFDPRVRRLYWQNKATDFVADSAGEAILAPQVWGRWRFEAR